MTHYPLVNYTYLKLCPIVFLHGCPHVTKPSIKYLPLIIYLTPQSPQI